MPDVAAVMVNWNGGDLAVRSAESVLAQDVRPVLWLVDNGSTDGSADRIAALPAADRVRLIRNDGNYGYARANNQALERIGHADYVLLVNNDVILPDPAGLAAVIGRMAADPTIQGACGRYEYPDGEFQHFYNRLPRPFDLMFHYGILKNLWFLIPGRQMDHYYGKDQDFTREMDLEQPAFACVLLTGAGLRAVGLMDERFPIFFNDVDYCWRWRASGRTWRYFPDWRVIHYKSKTTGTLGPALTGEQAGSVARFVRKHFRPLTATAVRAAVAARCGYRKIVRRDFPNSVAGAWRGDLPFTAANLAVGRPAGPGLIPQPD